MSKNGIQIMKKASRSAGLSACVGVVLAVSTIAAVAASDNTTFSPADKVFVAKVSQGGMFEVETSKVAKEKATAQDVIDTGFTEVHDHELVGEKLKSIATAGGLPFPAQLNEDFQSRLERLKALSGKDFDDGYIMEMDVIHKADGAAFAKEAKTGTNTALRQFAAQTSLIVRRHIGSLHAVPLPAK